MQGNIQLFIKNTMNDCKGTLINNFGDRHHRRIMSGITSQDDRIQVSINRAENEANSKYDDILELLAANKISLDLINIFPDNQVFTVNKSDKALVESLLNKDKLKYSLIEECSKISVIGSGMRGIPGVMARIIKSLNENNIEVLQTADSHMTIWCLVHSKDAINAINILHNAFSVSYR